eukprot:scaffold7049_cov147-Skeletonema_marinoi.AAC.4
MMISRDEKTIDSTVIETHMHDVDVMFKLTAAVLHYEEHGDGLLCINFVAQGARAHQKWPSVEQICFFWRVAGSSFSSKIEAGTPPNHSLAEIVIPPS